MMYHNTVASIKWHSFDSLHFSHIIKYQDNLTNSPSTCDLMEKLNTSHAEIFMKKFCTEKPTFTTGKKNVIQSYWHWHEKFLTSRFTQFWIWPSIALSIYFFDFIFRYFERFFTRIKTVSMELPTQSAIFLTFKINENISIQPGQYILLQCENLSTLEWHPFTITDFVNEPKQTTFTLAIGVRGDWTNELYQKIFNFKLHSEKLKRRRSRNRRRKSPAPRKLIFILDGPFPSTMEAITSNERVLLIGAGIGVTPYISIFNYIMWGIHKTIKAEKSSLSFLR